MREELCSSSPASCFRLCTESAIPLNSIKCLKDSSRFSNVSLLFLPCQLMKQLFANCFRRKDKNEGWYKMQSSISELLAGIFFDVFEFPSVCLYNLKHEMEMYVYQK